MSRKIPVMTGISSALALLLSAASAGAATQSDVTVLKIIERAATGPSAMCFVLDSRQSAVNDPVNLSSFVEVTPTSDKISLSAENDMLCVSGLQPGGSYTLKLKKGLKLKSGDSLAGDVQVPFSVSDAAPRIRLPHNMLLPKSGFNKSFAVETVNQSALRIDIYRLSPKSLNTMNLGSLMADSLNSYRAVNLIEQSGRKVYSKTFDLSSGKAEEIPSESTDSMNDTSDLSLNRFAQLKEELRNKPVYTEVQLSDFVRKDDEAMYLVVASDPRVGEDAEDLYDFRRGSLQSVSGLLMLTDLGITVYRSEENMTVSVRSLTAANTVTGAEVKLIAADNDILGSGVTDEKGSVTFDRSLISGKNALTPIAVAVKTANDAFVQDLRAAPLYIEGNKGALAETAGFETFAYTDRGIYRPGEAVHYTALVRDPSLKAVDTPVVLTVYSTGGNELVRELLTGAKSGGFEYDFKIPQGSALGSYKAVLSAGDRVLDSLYFTVSSMVPLQIRGSVINDGSLITPDRNFTVKSKTQFNYGSAAANLSGGFTLTLLPDESPVIGSNSALKERLKDYHFGPDARDRISSTQTEVYQGLRTDVEGIMQQTIRLQEKDYPQIVRVESEVFDTGNQPLRTYKTFRLAYNKPLIGVKRLDKTEGRDNVSFAVCSYLQDGSTFPQKVKYYLYKEFNDYNYVLENGVWQYVSFRSRNLIDQGSISVDNLDPEKALISRELADGRYVLELQGDRSSTVYAFGKGYQSSDNAVTPDRIDVFTDRSNYNPGDTVRLSFDSPFAGYANLAVGRQSVESLTVHTVKKGRNEISFKLGKDVNTQSHALLSLYSPAKETPGAVRAVGIADINTDLSSFLLNVETEVPAEIKPKEKLTVKIKAAPVIAGEGLKDPYAKITVVDTGILQLTNYKAPDPTADLLQDRKFAVDMIDSYGYIMKDPLQKGQGYGATAEGLFAAAAGGSGASVFNDTHIKSTAFASAIVPLDEKGESAVDFDLPQFSGSLKVMAVAWDQDRTGSDSEEIAVHDNAVFSPALPRFLNVGDEASVRLSLNNLKSQDPSFRADVSCTGSVSCSLQSALNLKPGARGEMILKLKALEEGKGSIRVRILNKEFNFDESYPFNVTTAQLPVYSDKIFMLKPQESVSFDSSAYFDSVKGAVIISSALPNVNTDSLLRNADIDSGTFSEDLTAILESRLLYGERLLHDVKDDQGKVLLPALFESEAQLNASIQELIDRICAIQGFNGSYGNDYETVYAADILLQALEKGFAVNRSTVDRLLAGLRQMSGNLGTYGAGSYANAVLSRTESINPADLRRVIDENILKQPLHLAFIADALGNTGDLNRAAEAADKAVAALLNIQSLNIKLNESTNAEEKKQIRRSIEDLSYPYTDNRSEAFIVLAVCLKHGFDQQAATLLEKLTLLRDTPAYMYEQTAAAVLRALKAAPADSAQAEQRFVSAEELQKPVVLENSSDKTVFNTVSVFGVPKHDRIIGNGFNVSVNYFDRSNRIDPAQYRFRLNEEVLAEINIRKSNTDENSDAVLKVKLPAGFEYVRQAGQSDPSFGRLLGSVDVTGADIQAGDDMLLVNYPKYSLRNNISLFIVLRAAVPGNYVQGEAVIQSKNNPSVFGSYTGADPLIISE